MFVPGSAIGTVTDRAGRFALPATFRGPATLGVSMIGYGPLAVRISVKSTEPVHIALQPRVYTLGEVTVTARRNRRWKKQLARFTKEVIGETENARHTRLLNPDVLWFKQRHGFLLAEASEPLVIENRALGYRIYYSLMHCVIEAERSQFKGIIRYEALTPRNAREQRFWEQQRDAAYRGSFKHLLHTLARARSLNDVEAEGFRLALVSEPPRRASALESAFRRQNLTLADLVAPAGRSYEHILQVDAYLLVSYPASMDPVPAGLNSGAYHDAGRRISSLFVRTDGTVVFHEDGYLYEPYHISIQGDMGRERLADMLPLEYRPAAPENELAVETRR